MWLRVFGGNLDPVDPDALLAHLRGLGLPVREEFARDEQGWFALDLFPDEGPGLHVERYQGDGEGIRPELNTWAAWVESTGDGPVQHSLMARLVTAAQLFAVRSTAGPDAVPDERLGAALCRYLAARTEGVWQADGLGFFDADGTLLLGEPSGE
jgi:hypothetical protein